MNKRNALIYGFSGMMLLLTGCAADEHVEKTNLTDPSDITVNSNSAELSKRLHMAAASPSAVRFAAGKVNDPAAPAVPAGAINIQDAGSNWNNDGKQLLPGKSYVIPEGESYDGTIMFGKDSGETGPIDIYVAGTMHITQVDVKSTNPLRRIYVLPTGSLTYQSHPSGKNEDVHAATEIYVWGGFVVPDNHGLRIVKGAKVHLYGSDSDSEFVTTPFPPGDPWNDMFKVEGEFYSSRKVLLQSPLQVSGNCHLDGCTIVQGDLSFYGNGNVTVGSYLKAANVIMAGGNIVLDDNALLEVDNNMYLSVNCPIEGGSASYAVISVKEFFCNFDPSIASVSGKVDIHYGSAFNGNQYNYNGEATIVPQDPEVKINGDTSIAPGDCHPGFNFENAQLELVAVVDVPTNEHDLSATSVTFNGNYAYVSWHKNPKLVGEGYGQGEECGIIDVVDISSQRIMQSLTNKTIRYNHSMYRNGALYTAGGSNKKGAMLSRIALENGLFHQNVEETLVTLSGASGNCVELVNDTFVTASAGKADCGFDFINSSMEIDKEAHKDATGAKYVYAGEQWIVTLNDPATGTVCVYDASAGVAGMKGAPVKSFATRPLEPEDGKNVIICDNERVYVCQGKNGLSAYDIQSGEEVARYEVKQVNGVDVDGEYVYVANGFGVTVLRKADLSYVSSYRDASASANFVRKGGDGYIYVAYGRNGLRVFSLQAASME